MTIVEMISASEARPTIDRMLLEDAPSHEIAKAIAAKHGVAFDGAAIDRYRKEAFGSENAPHKQIVRMTQDLSEVEPPPTDQMSRLSVNFSFQKTNEDLELIYERIRALRDGARQNPDDASYDKRIKDYLAQAEAIRTRVFRHQYEQIRHAILLTVGKKLAAAAISILIPYIHRDHKREAMRRFQSAVESLLDMKVVPDLPKDIASESPEA